MSYRNISLSTCGLTDKITRFTGENIPLNLCLSLHSAISGKRAKIMPIERAFPFLGSVGALRDYSRQSGRRVIFEYVLLRGFNDGAEDVRALADIARGNVHLNLIPYNGNIGGFEKPQGEEGRAFLAKLENAGVSATLRRTLGEDIDGACGQLRANIINKKCEKG